MPGKSPVERRGRSFNGIAIASDLPRHHPNRGERSFQMSWFRRKQAAVAATPEPAYVPIQPPSNFKPLTRPEGATEEDLRDGYTGMLVRSNKNCTTCYGTDFMPVEGKVAYCHCMRADDVTREYSARGQAKQAQDTSDALARRAARS